jgi:hypothetical protein
LSIWLLQAVVAAPAAVGQEVLVQEVLVVLELEQVYL